MLVDKAVRARVVVSLVVVAVIVAGACSGKGDDASRTRINVLDSTFTQSWQMMQDTGLVYRIEVISPAGNDTIRDVIPPAPVVVGDTLVIGLIQTAEDSSTPQRQFFKLRLGKHRIETTALPADVWSSYQDILVSPNGRYVAYVGEDTTPENPGTYGVIRNLATGEVVAKGPGGGGCDCDEDFNHARWFPPDSFEIAVAHTNTKSGWERIAGNATTRRIHVDTLSEEPDWH
jgi:hypothetical protein